jgi:hypothetical protein
MRRKAKANFFTGTHSLFPETMPEKPGEKYSEKYVRFVEAI